MKRAVVGDIQKAAKSLIRFYRGRRDDKNTNIFIYIFRVGDIYWRYNGNCFHRENLWFCNKIIILSVVPIRLFFLLLIYITFEKVKKLDKLQCEFWHLHRKMSKVI